MNKPRATTELLWPRCQTQVMAKYKSATTIQGNNNFLEDSGYIITSLYPTPKKNMIGDLKR